MGVDVRHSECESMRASMSLCKCACEKEERKSWFNLKVFEKSPCLYFRLQVLSFQEKCLLRA